MALTGNVTLQTTVAWTVGNTEWSVSAERTIANAQKPFQQIVAVLTASQVELLKIGAGGVAGELSDINFVVIINRDTINNVRIRLSDTGNDTSDHNVPPGGMVIFHNTDLSVSETGVAFVAFQTIDTIAAQFAVADGEVEIIAGRV